MDNLRILYDRLNTEKHSLKVKYYIPEAWNFTGYSKYTRDNDRMGEININPYDFILECIENFILPRAEADGSFLTPLGLRNDSLSVNPGKNTIYSMFPRMFTAWEHGDKGDLCSGTFLKAICLLPYLESLGIDIIYLLPIFKYSSRYKKGEIGSPYSIKNVYKLDENLHDPLLGEYSEQMLEMEFKAFVEACHILGIQVMVDYAFRTVSRDSDLIAEYPDWFYWIDKKYAQTFTAPSVENIKKPLLLNDRSLFYLYTSKNFNEYLAKFVRSPKDIDPRKWTEIVNKHRQTGENMLDLIEAEFGITTLPGFSDVINDSQPPWTDVTYLRFYFDVHEKARKYVGDSRPPYIMQDGVCLKLYPGKVENTGLMDYISGVIPYYQEKYGIDGARIDMGHALTPGLNKEIIARAKDKNRNFILWSEEFDPAKADISKENGFHFINGFIWAIYKDLEKPGFNKKLICDTLLRAAIPVIATLETPDTPRAACAHKDKRKIEQLVLLNCFLPNTVQFINNGFEVMEIQPMNLGLDNTEEGRFVLEKDDPMYGKLAFFDNYRINWLSSEREWMQKLLFKASGLRKSFIDTISKKENYVEQTELLKSKKLTFICYSDKESGRDVFFLANRSFAAKSRFNLVKLLPKQASESFNSVNIIYSAGDICETAWVVNKNRLLEPGEVIIGEIKYEK